MPILETASIIVDRSWTTKIIGMYFNLAIATILVYGATTKDTTILVIWLFIYLIQLIWLLIGLCSFAYHSEQLNAMYTSKKTSWIIPKQNNENYLEM